MTLQKRRRTWLSSWMSCHTNWGLSLPLWLISRWSLRSHSSKIRLIRLSSRGSEKFWSHSACRRSSIYSKKARLLSRCISWQKARPLLCFPFSITNPTMKLKKAQSLAILTYSAEETFKNRYWAVRSKRMISWGFSLVKPQQAVNSWLYN